MKTTLFFFGLAFTFLFYGAIPATITFKNNCPYTIWSATLTDGNRPQLSATGFELAKQAIKPVNVSALFTRRFWARTQCSTDPSSKKFRCPTRECGSDYIQCNGAGGAKPVLLIEFTIAGSNGQDFYDLSLVDAFNLPVSVSPQGGSGSTCKEASCKANINSVCPDELAVRGSNGVIACKSACAAFNQPEYCCTGYYNSPNTCEPTSYSMIFKNQCPDAYSYAYDDQTSTFACTGGPSYTITFCP